KLARVGLEGLMTAPERAGREENTSTAGDPSRYPTNVSNDRRTSNKKAPKLIPLKLIPQEQWGAGRPIEELQHKQVREFLDWVHARAVAQDGPNPGRTANKAREHPRAVRSWAWEQELIDTPPRFPKPRDQRDVAGRHYLTKAEINALYFATHQMKRPRGRDRPFPVGRYWRAPRGRFFKIGGDTRTAGKTGPLHQPVLWRHG